MTPDDFDACLTAVLLEDYDEAVERLMREFSGQPEAWATLLFELQQATLDEVEPWVRLFALAMLIDVERPVSSPFTSVAGQRRLQEHARMILHDLQGLPDVPEASTQTCEQAMIHALMTTHHDKNRWCLFALDAPPGPIRARARRQVTTWGRS